MKAIVIEDRGTLGPALVRQLEPMGVLARWLTHPVAADLRPRPWASVPLVLLDALDLSSRQDDHTRSRLTSLDVLQAAAHLPPPERPTIVVYSTHMAKPEVNIPLRGPGVATTFYEVGGLLEHPPTVVTGELAGQVPPPVPDDWPRLCTPTCARAPTWWPPTSSCAPMSARGARCGTPAPPSTTPPRLRVRRNVLPALHAESAGYKMAVEVVRRIAGLPYRW